MSRQPSSAKDGDAASDAVGRACCRDGLYEAVSSAGNTGTWYSAGITDIETAAAEALMLDFYLWAFTPHETPRLP
ncbi:hypothetical protein USDA257_p00200 (plasmid) [Sinorhizobium fredii USDA 257]|uniref:Uncharacterized protein n=1 Tax=Sinorhizobium fredii (strain USDA 257) TaxID=1185652 RepID=I3XFT3_SINF2|nr:hypothetical protein USDA257_p00200 [Sinorhizobium fredii USDA 257]